MHFRPTVVTTTLALALVGWGLPAFAASASSRHQHVRDTASLHEHVERAEHVVDRLLQNHQAGSTAAQPNTLIAVHRDDVMKLRDELRALDSAQGGASQAAQHGTIAAHVQEAQRLAARLNNPDAASASQPVGTSGSDRNTPATKDKSQAGRDDIVTVDRTTVKELNTEIQAIERLSRKS